MSGNWQLGKTTRMRQERLVAIPSLRTKPSIIRLALLEMCLHLMLYATIVFITVSYIECAQSIFVENGSPSYNHGIKYLDYAEITCSLGYRINGTGDNNNVSECLQCLDTGIWEIPKGNSYIFNYSQN